MRIGFLSHLDLNLWLFRLPVMQELVRLGHTVYALCPEGEYSGGFAAHGIIHVPYTIERSSLNPMKEIAAVAAIVRALRPLKLDLLHTFTAKPNIYGTIAAKIARIPRVVNLVEGLGSFYLRDDLQARMIRFAIEALYRLVFQLSDKVMFVNRDDPAYLIQHKIVPPSKVVVIDGVGIDTEAWQPLPKSDPRVVVLMIGRTLKDKGTLDFIEAARLVHRELPEVIFRFVGFPDSGNPSSLSEEFMRAQPEIEYLGKRDDIREQLANCDIFVLPSYREGMPRTIMEAMSMAKPIITTDVTGCRDTVEEGVNGLLVPPKSPANLAHALLMLLRNPSLRAQMGEASREMAIRRFDIKKIIQAHLEVYGLIDTPNSSCHN
ncbi:MAG: glycosyltransferase family 4 protein [Campylobacterales bacterium]